jgi:OmpR family response regulator RpaB
VIDDDPQVRGLLQLTLEQAGYGVTTACDGQDAIERLSFSRPSLVLLDLMMPRLDGFGFTAELERRGLRPAVPILVVSATDRAGEKAAQLRAEGYVAKPFDLTHLLSEVARLVPASAAQG